MIPAIVCIAKREENYIEEFVKYHLALGFKKIILYDNEDVPTYEKLLSNYREYLTVIHFPHNNYNKGVQYVALDHFIQNILFNSDITHVAHIDIDEYIVLKKHNNICEFIDEYIVGDCQAIGMNWRYFGSSNKTDYEKLPITTRFTMCGNQGNKHIKTIFKKDKFYSFGTVHEVYFKEGYTKSTSGHLIHGSFNYNIDLSVIQLNHYKSKTLPEYVNIRRRGRADVASYSEEKIEDVTNDFNAANFNETECTYARDFYIKNCLS